MIVGDIVAVKRARSRASGRIGFVGGYRWAFFQYDIRGIVYGLHDAFHVGEYCALIQCVSPELSSELCPFKIGFLFQCSRIYHSLSHLRHLHRVWDK